jgi:hypothetical protein
VNVLFTLVGLLSFGVAAGAMSLGIMHALDVKHDTEIREQSISARRANIRRTRAEARQEQRLAELTFWGYEQRQRRFDNEIEARRRARRK